MSIQLMLNIHFWQSEPLTLKWLVFIPVVPLYCKAVDQVWDSLMAQTQSDWFIVLQLFNTIKGIYSVVS